MRIISIILNITLIFIVLGLVVDDGWPQKVHQQLMVIVFFVTPIISLITLWGSKAGKSESWLSLFFQRKRLEEKIRLKKLKQDNEKT